MAATYEPIASTTLGSDTGSVSLSGISGAYTDLVVVCDFAVTGANNAYFRVGNGSVDSGTNYSQTYLSGNGTSATSGRRTSNDGILIANANSRGASNRNLVVLHLMSYANTSVYKTLLMATASPSVDVYRDVALWRSTSAIDVITFLSNGNYATGSTFSLYGLAAA